MKSLDYRHSDNTRFLWQGPESGNEDIAQQVEEAERSTEKNQACSEFSGELGDLAELCTDGRHLAPMNSPLSAFPPDHLEDNGDDGGYITGPGGERYDPDADPYGLDGKHRHGTEHFPNP